MGIAKLKPFALMIRMIVLINENLILRRLSELDSDSISSTLQILA